MIDNNTAYTSKYIEELMAQITDAKLKELLAVEPRMSYDVYKRTTLFYANEQYDEYLDSPDALPHGFYTVLEDSMRNTSFISTIKKYDKFIRQICNDMNIEYKEFLELLKAINMNRKVDANRTDNVDQVSARARLREIIRKYVSIHKENMIKDIQSTKMAQLDQSVVVNHNVSAEEMIISYDDFVKENIGNPSVIFMIRKMIKDNLNIVITDLQAAYILRARFNKKSSNYVTEIAQIVGIVKPKGFEDYQKMKSATRLKISFQRKLNEMFASLSLTEKDAIAYYINTRAFTDSQSELDRVLAPARVDERFAPRQPISFNSKFKNRTTPSNFDVFSAVDVYTHNMDSFVTSSYISYRNDAPVVQEVIDDKALANTRALISRKQIPEIETIIAQLRISDGRVVLDENGEFVFEFNYSLDTYQEIKDYNDTLNAIRSIANKLFVYYKKSCEALKEFTGDEIAAAPVLDDDGYSVDTSKWLDTEKISKLIEKIDLNKLYSLTPLEFNELKSFLVDKGLLWAYIAGNVSLEMVARIINNFSSIYANTRNDEINIDNLQSINKTANLYDYADPITIGLIGIENVSKIINYNQFNGVALTDELIRSRLRKVVDLAVRSERIRQSSLPFKCDVKANGYMLQRYLNNDPSIFISGIETKTCFFVSVNENDLFFYSLLNKDGYVLRIVDRNNNFVARATCWRKNNVLMINGIRFANNKVNPENKEDMDQFETVVKLVEIFAKKMIESTSSDKCPIDYVVCNRAGILENDCFEGRYEKINSTFFNTPINIYNPEWKEFVHLYDDEDEQLLQEVPVDPEHSFVTDFGNHYPALLISSRNYMGLTSPRHISLDDQDAIYDRPRRSVKEFISEEISMSVINHLNRINALTCFTGSKEEQEIKKKNYRLINDLSAIKNVILGEDWYIMIRSDESYVVVFANNNREAFNEAKFYIEKIKNSLKPYQPEIPGVTFKPF